MQTAISIGKTVPNLSKIVTDMTPQQLNQLNEEYWNFFGTERDKYNCAFYIKTGSCRFGDRCGKQHPYPSVSHTVLFKNMYDGVGMSEVADDDCDDDLQYDEKEIMKHYTEFYNDVFPEFRQFGEIANFKVCRNAASHLRGNVYIQYKNIEDAVKAAQAFAGRFYAKKNN